MLQSVIITVVIITVVSFGDEFNKIKETQKSYPYTQMPLL